jgi:hypothetical protein
MTPPWVKARRIPSGPSVEICDDLLGNRSLRYPEKKRQSASATARG